FARQPHVYLARPDAAVALRPVFRPRVFQPSFTTKAPGHGTGMGLSMVHGIVTGAAGGIRVESEPGHGSAFRLRFPRQDPAEVSGVMSEVSGSVPAGRGVVLRVEDEPAVRA